jgi:hypothetical protein
MSERRTAIMRMFLLTSDEVKGDFVSVTGQRVRRRTKACYVDASAPQDPLWASAAATKHQSPQQQKQGQLPIHLLMGGSSIKDTAGPTANVLKAAAALVASPSSTQLWTMTPVVAAVPSSDANDYSSSSEAIVLRSGGNQLHRQQQSQTGWLLAGAAGGSSHQPDWLSSRPFQQLDLHQSTFLPSPLAMASVLPLVRSPRSNGQLAAYFQGLQRSAGSSSSVTPLSSHPLQLQEAVLVSSLLLALGGIPSRFVRAKAVPSSSPSQQAGMLSNALGSRSTPLLAATMAACGGNFEFVLSCDDPAGLSSSLPFSTLPPSFLASVPSQSVASLSLLFAPDPSLGYVARKVLPLAGLYCRCKHLVACLKSGASGAGGIGGGAGGTRVRQALAAACDGLLSEYESLLLQLEALSRQGQAHSSYDAAASAAASVGRPLPLSSRPGHSPATTLAGPAAPTSTAANGSAASLSLQQLWFYVQPP